jgi:inner membrane protein
VGARLLSWLLAKILREPGGWKALYGVCALALGVHIAGDLITSFGTIIFAPLSDARYAWGTTFIIDLWVTGIIAAGLLASVLWRRSRVPAMAAGLVLVCLVGLQAVQKERALDYARRMPRSRAGAAPRSSRTRARCRPSTGPYSRATSSRTASRT